MVYIVKVDTGTLGASFAPHFAVENLIFLNVLLAKKMTCQKFKEIKSSFEFPLEDQSFGLTTFFKHIYH